MPVVHITLTPQSKEAKAEMARAITDDVVRVTGVPPQAVTVLFNELPAECIATAGTLLPDRRRRQKSNRLD